MNNVISLMIRNLSSHSIQTFMYRRSLNYLKIYLLTNHIVMGDVVVVDKKKYYNVSIKKFDFMKY